MICVKCKKHQAAYGSTLCNTCRPAVELERRRKKLKYYKDWKIKEKQKTSKEVKPGNKYSEGDYAKLADYILNGGKK